MQHEYFINWYRTCFGSICGIFSVAWVCRVVYSHHISGSIRSSNLADPHSFIRGCESATLLDRIDIEYGLDPFVVWIHCYYNVAIFIMAIGIFILQMVQAWYILLNACSICTMKIPSTTMKIALSYIYVSYTYIYMYYKHYFLVFSYNAKSSAGFVFFYSIKLSSVHFLS